MITQKRLKEVLIYNENTGVFYWVDNRNKNAYKGKVAGSLNSKGYRRIMIDGVEYHSHSLAWLFINGVMPKMLDHINHIKIDNRICNLRVVTYSENQKNLPLYRKNKSGHSGVCYVKSRKKWQVTINANGKPKQLGRFDSKEEAIRVRRDAEALYGYHDNHGKV